MMRFIALLMLAGNAYAAAATVDIDTAAKIYQAAAVREQVRAALPTMPKQIRDMFSRDASAQLSDEQLAAVSAAAERGFRIDVFETPALGALAQNLDSPSVVKIQAFLAGDLGKRMVTADVEAATMGETNIDKVMNGEQTVPSTPKRDALFEKLERATKSTESTVQIFLSMGQAVALGTAIGSSLQNIQGFQMIMSFLVMPIFFLSGALYPLNNLPTALNLVVTDDPLAYGVDSLRSILIGSSHFGLMTDATVLLAVGTVVLLIGSRLFSKIQV